jgi:hypothetical protein
MKRVEAVGMKYEVEDQKADRNPQRQAQDMDESPEFVSGKIPPGDFKVVFDHGLLIERLQNWKIG